MKLYSGNVLKMESSLSDPIEYRLPIGEGKLALNPLLGKALHLRFEGRINCIACGRRTKKSYSQGHCYPCSQRLASTDLCIVRPEKCHYAEGSCREPEWGQANCMQPHYVYLANTSGLKVGITRLAQVPTRWIDQGASQALPILQVDSRLHAGLIEVILKKHVADRTDWRRMLKGEAEAIDLYGERDRLLAECAPQLDKLAAAWEEEAVLRLDEAQTVQCRYPVVHYPDKVRALNFDKTADISGVLEGVKGQYLLLDSGVLNIRKFSGYYVDIKVG